MPAEEKEKNNQIHLSAVILGLVAALSRCYGCEDF